MRNQDIQILSREICLYILIAFLPHQASKSYHVLENGTIIASEGSKKSYANMLPDGRYMTTQCFWINNDYIVKQIKDELK